jgi:hypothetical protein
LLVSGGGGLTTRPGSAGSAGAGSAGSAFAGRGGVGSAGSAFAGRAGSGGTGDSTARSAALGGTSYTTTQWLAFNGARANGAVEPNASVGVDGAFRVNSDSCTATSFDAAKRCVSGVLCSYGYDNQYWGVALVFDFRTDGVRKWRWDPQAYGAVGVAYSISGRTIPRLQLWVLEMDTATWTEPCQAESCEIIGPPYGDSNVSGMDALYFDRMIQDDWAGTGISYVHQAKNTLSLQFKIPAVIVGSVPFEFCIDGLGVIRVSGA